MVLALSAIAHTAIRKLSQSSVLQLFAERTRRIYERPRQLAFASPLRFVFVAVSAAVPRSAAALPRPPWYKASAQVQALWGCVTRASVSALSRRRASRSLARCEEPTATTQPRNATTAGPPTTTCGGVNAELLISDPFCSPQRPLLRHFRAKR